MTLTPQLRKSYNEVVAHVYDFRWDGFQVSELHESTADWRFNHGPVGKDQVLSGAR